MQIQILGIDGSKTGSMELPHLFELPPRPDLVHRGFVALATHSLQPKGTDPLAGERTSALSWGTGRGAARMARVKGERHPRAGQAAGVAGVVKGRLAHPPRAEKKIRKELNRKERWLATAHAIASTAWRELVQKRGHRIDGIEELPIVVSDDIQRVARAKDLKAVLEALRIHQDVERAIKGRKRLSGTSRMRGRVTRVPKGPLLIVERDEGIGRAVRSFPGVNCVLAKDLSLLELAPGSVPGRLCVWSESALRSIPKGVLSITERANTKLLARAKR